MKSTTYDTITNLIWDAAKNQDKHYQGACEAARLTALSSGGRWYVGRNDDGKYGVFHKSATEAQLLGYRLLKSYEMTAGGLVSRTLESE